MLYIVLQGSVELGPEWLGDMRIFLVYVIADIVLQAALTCKH